MTLLDHPGPWTEADYRALGEFADRFELIDGALWVFPAPARPHQDIAHLLLAALRPVVRAERLRATGGVRLRLAPARIVTPDLVVTRADATGDVTAAADVVLVGEITAPGTAAMDRVLKKHLYAAARIGWYLLVEPDMGDYSWIRLRLLRLDGRHYVEHAVAEHGQILTADGPFPIEIDTEELLDFWAVRGSTR